LYHFYADFLSIAKVVNFKELMKSWKSRILNYLIGQLRIVFLFEIIHTMEKLEDILFYTMDKSIRSYRVFAQKRLRDKGFQITIDQWLILKVLMDHPGIMQQEVAEMVFKDNASVTRIIDILEKSKYLRKKTNPNDRRKFILKITPSGERVIQEVQKIVLENRAMALSGISEKDLEITSKVLNQIIENSQKGS
jgi:MarR family transcriptional regulator for hemolysin